MVVKAINHYTALSRDPSIDQLYFVTLPTYTEMNSSTAVYMLESYF